MGLKTNNSNNIGKVYLNIIGGKIARRHKEHVIVAGNTLTVEREIRDRNTNAVIKTVIEQYFDTIDGIVTEAKINTEGNYGATLEFTIQDEETFILSIPLDSSYGNSILKKMPNIDAKKEVSFSPFNFESKTEMGSDGNPKKIVGCNIFQYGRGLENNKVPNYWTKDNPRDLPQWEKSKLGKWDNTKQLDYLAEKFLEKASEFDPLSEDLKKAEAKKTNVREMDIEDIVGEDEDDLPF